MNDPLDLSKAEFSVQYTGENDDEVLDFIVRAVTRATSFDEEDVRRLGPTMDSEYGVYESTVDTSVGAVPVIELRQLRPGDRGFAFDWGIHWEADQVKE